MPSGTIYRLLIDGLSIILIDLLLAGDNALVIAMAVRGLPAQQRRLAIAFGSGAAVGLRVAITVVAAKLLGVEFIKLVGGAVVLWIAVKVLADAGGPPAAEPVPGQLFKAIWLIVFADITICPSTTSWPWPEPPMAAFRSSSSGCASAFRLWCSRATSSWR